MLFLTPSQQCERIEGKLLTYSVWGHFLAEYEWSIQPTVWGGSEYEMNIGYGPSI